jgi:hypothetical protein
VRAALHRALRDAHEFRHLGDRPVLDVQEMPRAFVRRSEFCDGAGEVQPVGRTIREIIKGDLGDRFTPVTYKSLSGPQPQCGLTAGDGP